MIKTFSSALKGVRGKKIGYIAQQLDFMFKNIIRKFDSTASIENEKKNAAANQKELAAEFKTKGLGIAKSRCEYLSF